MLKICDFNNFDRAFEILEYSFPLTERRNYKGQRDILNCENYRLYALFSKDGECVLAVCGVWILNGVNFIEHFAVNKNFRNQGIGSKMLNLLGETLDGILCLEVEPPLSNIQKKRIDFYLKNNFFLNDYYYLQPSYGEDYPELELKIMSRLKPLNKTEFNFAVSEIYNKVYKKPVTFLTE